MIVMMILLRMMNFVLKMQIILMMRLKLNFLSSLESIIHNSSSQKEIIEKLKNKISEFELNVQSYESKLQNLEKIIKCT
jgi:hypothetical protein